MQMDFFSKWQQSDALENLRELFVQHFDYLVDNDRYEIVLGIIAQEISALVVDDEKLVFKFGEKEELLVYPPSSKETLPKSSPFYHLLKHHEFLYLENAQIQLGDHCLFEDIWLDDIADDEDLDLYQASKGDLSVIKSPMTDYADLWVYHPSEINPSGKPKLYTLCHEVGDIDESTELNVGSLFLHRFAETLELEFEDLVVELASEAETEAWWNSLEESVKSYFLEEYECDGTPLSITKLWKNRELQFDDDVTIHNIQFLKRFQKLTKFNAVFGKGTDLSPLYGLNELIHLDLANSDIEDIGALGKLTELRTLNLASTIIDSITPLEACERLRELDLSNTVVADISVVKTLFKLSYLNISYSKVMSISCLKGLSQLKELHVDGLQLDDYSIIKELPQLNWLNMNESNFPDFRELIGIKKISTIYCMGVPASFTSCLEFLSSLRENPIEGFTMENKYDSPFELLPALQNLEVDPLEYSEELYLFLYSSLRWYHRPEYIEVVNQILEEFSSYRLQKPKAFKKRMIKNALEFYIEQAGLTNEITKNKYLELV